MRKKTKNNNPWVVFDYEVEQFYATCKLLLLKAGNDESAALPQHMKNAVVESALLHARILSDILLSRGREPDDINLSDLLPSFDSTARKDLECVYGNGKTEGSPCWTLNKRLAHATYRRGSSYDYTQLLSQLAPLISRVVQDVNGQRQKSSHDNERERRL